MNRRGDLHLAGGNPNQALDVERPIACRKHPFKTLNTYPTPMSRKGLFCKYTDDVRGQAD